MHFNYSALAIVTTTIFVTAEQTRAASIECEYDRYELFVENEDFVKNFEEMMDKCIGDLYDGKQCDISDTYKGICEGEGADYFTVTSKVTCTTGDGDNLEFQDLPACFPKSCTKNKAHLAELIEEEEDYYSNFMYGDCEFEYDFDGISSAPSHRKINGSFPALTLAFASVLIGVALL